MARTLAQSWMERYQEEKEVSWELMGEIILDVLDAHQETVGGYISQGDLWRAINGELGFLRSQEDSYPVTKRKIRACIRDMRRQGILIISQGGIYGGYKMAKNLEEVREFVKVEFRSKALDMLTTGSRMMEGARAHYGGQTLWDYGVDQDLHDLTVRAQRMAS